MPCRRQRPAGTDRRAARRPTRRCTVADRCGDAFPAGAPTADAWGGVASARGPPKSRSRPSGRARRAARERDEACGTTSRGGAAPSVRSPVRSARGDGRHRRRAPRPARPAYRCVSLPPRPLPAARRVGRTAGAVSVRVPGGVFHPAPADPAAEPVGTRPAGPAAHLGSAGRRRPAVQHQRLHLRDTQVGPRAGQSVAKTRRFRRPRRAQLAVAVPRTRSGRPTFDAIGGAQRDSVRAGGGRRVEDQLAGDPGLVERQVGAGAGQRSPGRGRGAG